jgi:eukaryotic-like serine/threonine-protein kinase
MTSEFIEGQSLKELMAARIPEMPEVLALAKQLCAALDYAHDKGVFHHFLNPSNIKVLPDGTLKVLDFGLLRDKNLLSQTPAKKLENEPYLSPEEVKGKPPDRATNLFSAAAILYQLYTARSPFAGKHLGEVDRAIIDGVPHPLNMAHPRVPPAISGVILRALSKPPRDRYQSGKDLAEALELATKAEPVRATPSPTAKPAAPKAALLPDFTQQTMPAPAPAPRPNVPPATVRIPAKPAPATARIQVRDSKNYWKVIAGVVACLVVVAGLAAVFQRKPSEVVTETPAPQTTTPVKQAPVQVNEPAPPAEEPAPVVESEEAPENIVVGNTIVAKRSRVARAPRKKVPAGPVVPQEGELAISSMPADAKVEIEGVAQSWVTPQVVSALPVGAYKVTVSKAGFAPEIRNIQIGPGSRTSMDVKLTAVKGFLTVAGSPTGASILIDGRDSGRVTPATLVLDPAAHNVVLRKAGYLDAGSEIKLAAGQAVSYSPSLMVAGRTDNMRILTSGMGRIFGSGGSSQGKARIEIKSDPKGAQVIINGTPLQKTTPVEIQVEAGNYDITLQKEGYKAIHESAIVGIEDRVKIDKTLSR